jgi:hypothetical protein
MEWRRRGSLPGTSRGRGGGRMGRRRHPSSPLQSDRWWLAPATFCPRRGVGHLQGARPVLHVQMAGLKRPQIASVVVAASSSRSTMISSSSSSAPPALRTGCTTSLQSPRASPLLKLLRKAAESHTRRIAWVRFVLSTLRMKFEVKRPLFIGNFAPRHRGLGGKLNLVSNTIPT